jgi:hypothetical protein
MIRCLWSIYELPDKENLTEIKREMGIALSEHVCLIRLFGGGQNLNAANRRDR